MDYVKKLTFPPKTPDRFIQEVASKIGSWYIVTNLEIIGRTVNWNQTTYCGHGAEGLSAFVEGLMLGFNVHAKTCLTHTVCYPGCNPYTC